MMCVLLGLVSTVYGSGVANSVDGVGTAASFYSLRGISVSSDGSLYCSEYSGHIVRKIATSGKLETALNIF